jgi:hypothetical protein
MLHRFSASAAAAQTAGAALRRSQRKAACCAPMDVRLRSICSRQCANWHEHPRRPDGLERNFRRSQCAAVRGAQRHQAPCRPAVMGCGWKVGRSCGCAGPPHHFVSNDRPGLSYLNFQRRCVLFGTLKIASLVFPIFMVSISVAGNSSKCGLTSFHGPLLVALRQNVPR